MAILVSDANIVIDLEVSGALRELFQLADSIATPDVLFEEELSHHHPELLDYGLRVVPLSDTAVAYVEEVRARHVAPSTNDFFALALARFQSWPLLTGDSKLRQVAEIEGVEVHGTIWLIERMVIEKVISLHRAEQCFRLMRENGRRLPWAEADALLRKLTD